MQSSWLLFNSYLNPMNPVGCKTGQNFKSHKPDRLGNRPAAVILM